MKLFTVKDKVAETFQKPFGMTTERDAIDGFRHVTNEADTPFNKFPEDFCLVKLGTFDERTGLFDTHKPIIIAEAKSLHIEKGN